MRNTKYSALKHIAYISAIILLIAIFGLKHGLLTFLALMMFGFGMNLENNHV